MESRKICLVGFVVSIVVHLTLSHSPDEQKRTGGAPGLSEDAVGSTEQVESCKKIDEKSLILLCRNQCKINIGQEVTNMTQIDNETWLTSQESFEKTPNQCNCCKTEMPFTEKPMKDAVQCQTRRVFSSYGGSVYDDDYYKQLRIVQDEVSPFVLISILTILIFGMGSCYLLIFSLCFCCQAYHSRGKKVVKTRPILISSCSSGDSVTSTTIDCESQVEPNKDNDASQEDLVSKPFTTPDSHPAIQVTVI